MDTARFDRLTRSVSTLLSRRTAASAVGLAVLAMPGLAEANKHRHKKKKKPKFNDFGCVDVGGFCKNADQCCSGICQGKKSKKKCQAHDVSTCQAGQTAGLCGGEDVPCVASNGSAGVCGTTTGKAGYCRVDTAECMDCTKDADCVPFCGSSAACIVCDGICGLGGFTTACTAAVGGSCTPPPP
jgi:hypothetical protein